LADETAGPLMFGCGARISKERKHRSGAKDAVCGWILVNLYSTDSEKRKLNFCMFKGLEVLQINNFATMNDFLFVWMADACIFLRKIP